MATLKELMGDLTRGDGRIVYSDDHGTRFEPIFLDTYGVWHGICDDFLVEAFDQFQEWDWQPYTEPKPKKKVTMIDLNEIEIRFGDETVLELVAELKVAREELMAAKKAKTEILKYCKPNADYMWAAIIAGILLDLDFKDAAHELKTSITSDE